MKLKQGDQVKLRGAAGLARRSSGGRRIDWTKRVGTFVRTGVNGTVAHIMWPGNQGVDIWPLRAVVKVEHDGQQDGHPDGQRRARSHGR